MYLYRVDKRLFKSGDEIKPQSKFEDTLKGEVLMVENILNKVRPSNIPERDKCLFLFCELFGALTFFSKYGGHIYKVTPINIYHRGDMNKIDNILDVARFSEDENILEAVANEYWKAGTHTFHPCYEYLVEKAIVVDCIASENDREKFLLDFKYIHSIERTSLYKTLVTK